MPEEIFPTLKIDPKDVFGSWKNFIDRFTVAIKYQVKNKGKITVGTGETATQQNVFDDEMKLYALLRAVSSEGFQVLQAQGIDINSEDLTYEQVLKALKNTYEREESLNVKLWNFSSARQQTGEDSRDYLRRVEHLSRTTGIFKADETGLDVGKTEAANRELERVRQTMAQVFVVNGLKDLKLRRELMAKHDLTWDILCSIVANRGTAAESDEKLERPAPQVAKPSVAIKQEVAEARFENYRRDGSRSRYDRFYDSRDYSRRNYDRDNSRPRDYHRSNSRDRYGSSSRQRFNSGNRSGYDSYRRDSRERRYNSRDRHYGSNHDGYRNRPRSLSRDRRGSSRESDQKSYDSAGKSRCYNCGDRSHRIRDCPHVTCHICSDKGHTAIDCRKDKIKPSDSSRDSYHRSDYPKPLRSRDPSPYPDRGRKASPNHYMEVRRVNVNPDKLFGNS